MGYRTFVGTVTFRLSRLAALTGDLAEAESHLTSALSRHTGSRGPPRVALSKHALAGALEARGRPLDHEWIDSVRSGAACVADRLGMRSLSEGIGDRVEVEGVSVGANGSPAGEFGTDQADIAAPWADWCLSSDPVRRPACDPSSVVSLPYPVPSSDAVTTRMKANRRVDTGPEVALRSSLHRAGLRFWKDRVIVVKGRRVRPDIVFPPARVAVFVDGCFWHCCPEHGSVPQRNVDYWVPKLQRNVARDAAATAALEADGWRVIRVWEHEPIAEARDRIAVAVGRLP